jgi:hypothetical protein
MPTRRRLIRLVGRYEKNIIDKKRQEVKDEADSFDLKIKRWIYKTKTFPIFFSSAALIGTGISIYISTQALNYKREPINLQQVKKQIEALQEHAKLQDALFRMDTLSKKRK